MFLLRANQVEHPVQNHLINQADNQANNQADNQVVSQVPDRRQNLLNQVGSPRSYLAVRRLRNQRQLLLRQRKTL